MTGVGESVNVTIANGVMPLLRDTKPFFSYTGLIGIYLFAAAAPVYARLSGHGCAVGPAPPPVVNISNIGARHLDLNWRVAYDLWDALTTSGYRYA